MLGFARTGNEALVSCLGDPQRAVVAAMLIPGALGRSSEAVIKEALEETGERVAEPDLVG